MANYRHTKAYSAWGGLDLRSSDIMRPPGLAREALNTMRSQSGGLMPRYGHKHDANGVGMFGLWPYQAANLLSGSSSTPGILGCGSPTSLSNHKLYKRPQATAATDSGLLTFTNTHGSLTATVSHYYDEATSQFRFRVVRGGATVHDIALGSGLAGSPYAIADLITAVHGVSSCNLVNTGGLSTSVAAAMLAVVADVTVAAGATTTISYMVWDAVPTPNFRVFIEDPTVAVSVANDTIYTATLNAASTQPIFENPYQNGDPVYWVAPSGSTCPTGFNSTDTYYVVSATKTTVKLAATLGGSAINITGTGSGNLYLASREINPGATFGSYETEFAQATWRPVSSVVNRGCRYFSSGPSGASYREVTGLSKYDGQMFYRAGMPIGKNLFPLPGALVGAGSQTDVKGACARTSLTGWAGAATLYDFNFKFVDAVGNIIEGTMAGPTFGAPVVPGNGVNALTIDSVGRGLHAIARQGFKTNYGVTFGGSQTTLTPAVRDGTGNGHYLQVGDIAYFWDQRQGRYIQRQVMSVAVASQITISSESLDKDPTSPNYDDGLTPTFNDGAAISANLRICIWRSTIDGTGTSLYLVGEIPWCPLYSVYYDDMSDSTLVLQAEFVAKPYEPDLPPACRHLATFNGQIVAFGNDKAQQTIYFEDSETPEGMPAGTHNFELETAVAGAKQSGEVLVCGTKSQLSVVSGDLSEFKFRVDKVSDNLGIMSHESMQEVEEGILFWLSNLGPYGITGGRQIAPLGTVRYPDNRVAGRVEPYFTANYNSSTTRPVFERATAVVLPKDRLYVLFVPVENQSYLAYTASGTSVTTSSLAWAYDYGRNEFHRWNQVDYSAACQKDGVLYYCTRMNLTNAFSGIGAYHGHQVRDKGRYCFADSLATVYPLTWSYQPHWESLGRPGFFKRLVRVRAEMEDYLTVTAGLTIQAFFDTDIAKYAPASTITWATTAKEYTMKLSSETCRSAMVAFSGSQYYRPVSMAGYELEFNANFREVIKE